jgi:hypothetical protein
MAWIFDGSGGDAVWTTNPFDGAPTALDVRAAVACTDWTPATAMTVVSQSLYLNDGTGGMLAGGLFAFGIDGSGGGALTGGSGDLWVYLPVWPTSQYFYGSGSAVPASPGDVYCIRFTFSDSANDVKFWYKATTAGNAETDMAAHTGWTQLGSTDTHSYSLTASGDILLLGKDVWSPDTYHFDGTIYAASAATTIGGSALASAESSEAGTAGTWVSSTGETWYTEDYTGPPPILADISTADRWSISPTWVSVMDLVRSASIRRQATLRQPGSVTAGTAALVVKNADRAFDPAYTSGPFGTWTPGRRIRVRCVHAGVTYGLLEGYIANIRQSYDAGSPRYSDAELEVIDGWGDLNQQDVTDWLYTAIDGLSPDFWWRLGEPGKIQTEVVAGANATSPVSLLSQNSASSDEQDQNYQLVGVRPTVSYFPTQNGGWAMVAQPSFTDVDDQTVSVWIRTTTLPSGADVATIYDSAIARLGIASTGLSIWYDGAEIPLNAGVADGNPHHIALVCANGALTVYIDGVRRADDPGGANARLLYAGGPIYIASTGEVANGVDYQGDMWDLAVWTDVALSAANVLAIYNAGTGYVGDRSDARIGRILDAAGWPTGWRSLATGKATCGGQVIVGQASEMLRQVAATEYGLLFIDRDGSLRFRNRFWTAEETTGTTSQATFSDDGAGISYQAGGLDWDVEQWFLNNAVVTGVGGASAKRSDTSAAIRRSLNVSTLLQSSADCSALAGKIVRHRSDALTSLRPWVCRPQDTEWATVLALELGDRVTVEITPQGVGSQMQLAVAVSGISHDINPGRDWRVTFDGDPIDPTSYLILGTGTLGVAGGYVLG